MTGKKSRLGWPQWIILAIVGAGLPFAACQRSLGSRIDFPPLADAVTVAYYVLVLACLGVVLAVTLPRSR